MTVFGKIMDLIAEGIKWIVSCILVFMVVVTFLEVIRRYMFGLSFGWADECIRFLIMWITFLGGAAAFRKGKLVCFDLVTGILSERTQLILKLLMNVVLLFILAGLFFYTMKTVTSPSVTRAVGTGFKVSMIYAYLPMPVGFGLMELFCIDNVMNLVSRLRGGQKE